MRSYVKKLVLVGAVLACAFAAVAGEKSARSSGSDTILNLGF